VKPENLGERAITRALAKPPTIRVAASVIVTVTFTIVIAGGLLMRLLNASEFPSLGDALWWSLQTATTVGYGDIVPENTLGRIIAAVVMLQGVAFITVVTAVITSAFVERTRRERATREGATPGTLQETLESLDRRLANIEEQLSRR
jgi:voltage-gated potassium channel Kch